MLSLRLVPFEGDEQFVLLPLELGELRALLLDQRGEVSRAERALRRELGEGALEELLDREAGRAREHARARTRAPSSRRVRYGAVSG